MGDWLMGNVFSNVSIDNMNFISKRQDMKFEFIDSFKNSNQSCGHIICKNIFIFKMDTAFEDNEFDFPCFICDVNSIKIEKSDIELTLKELKYAYKDSNGLAIPNREEYYLVKMEGGELAISILCAKVEVNKV